jgi:LysM domain-containing protein
VDDEAVKGRRRRRRKAGDTDPGARAEAEAAREAEAEVAADPAGATPSQPVSPTPGDELIEDLREVRAAATKAIGPTKRYVERPQGPSAAVLAAVLFLVGSALLSVSFMLTRGGLSIPIGSPEPSTVAVASESPVVATPTPEPTATPLLTPEPTPSPTPAPPTPTPDPRLALLVPCPDEPDCYLYTIRTDDSLGRISRRFTIPVDTILELNPWITDPSIIHPGEVLTLPPPG